MTDQNKSIIAAIKHFISSHPEIAAEIERYAARSQGKSDQDFHNFAEWKRYQNLSTQEIFEKIYEEGHWGKNPSKDGKYFSGTGSHDPVIVKTYVDAVSAFLQSLPEVPDALDIGCGDFNVGSRLRPFCKTYTAADIAPKLIAFNTTRFAELDVDFRVLNIIEEPAPAANVVFIRQVLQHLSNAEIKRALGNLAGRFDHLIVTEHVPPGQFTPNLDKTTGRGIRIRHNSGVVLSEPPFGLSFREQKVLCEVPELGGVIRTTVYSA
ncbi:MAG: class I SAM-dependent methyltransferase [Brevundimonas sp.]|uniref:class I SAM-dependent methyltransferase n=1 Tax=Brevundimonas sp. TaxID=1871086 RepID=UPI002732D957|nr:class I SAM-dependent methyltransferase [Brevundimonas sp.]MDP3405933.1 class I SAM-dependent methyltransferase [Brevundimonas sp.]